MNEIHGLRGMTGYRFDFSSLGAPSITQIWTAKGAINDLIFGIHISTNIFVGMVETASIDIYIDDPPSPANIICRMYFDANYKGGFFTFPIPIPIKANQTLRASFNQTGINSVSCSLTTFGIAVK